MCDDTKQERAHQRAFFHVFHTGLFSTEPEQRHRRKARFFCLGVGIRNLKPTTRQKDLHNHDKANNCGAALACVAAVLVSAGCATPQKYANHRDLYAQGLYKESIADFEAEMPKRQKKAGQDENGEALPVPASRDYALDDIEMGAGYRALCRSGQFERGG